MKRGLLPLVALLAGAPAVGARAQEPVEQRPHAAQRVATVSLVALSGLSDRGERYVMKRQRVFVSGTLRRFAPGQVAVVEVRRRGRRAARVRVEVAQAGDAGRFKVHFTARRAGTYSVRARVEDGAGATAARSKRLSVHSTSLRAASGSSGVKVRLLQRGLRALGFAASRGGRFDAATERAVLAFRKTNGMRRRGFASRAVYSLLFRGRGGFRLRHPKAGKHVEFDWSRQVLALARGGRAERVYHASSGTASTPTVFGSFRFYRRQPGTNSHGMVFSSYFIGGYAIHGYASVPNYPASHGCIRVPIPSAVPIYRWIDLRDRIYVYR